MGTFLQDLRFGLRMLARNPGFTAVAVLTLALGIGANLAVFSVVRGVLLRPLPYHNPSRLVEVYTSNPSRAAAEGPFSPQDLEDFRSQSNSFESVSGYWYSPGMSVSALLNQGEPTLIETASVDSDFLPTLGVKPVLGRGFTFEENIAGKDDVVILSDSVWRQRFNSDPSIVGKTITLGGKLLVVVGVMGPEFRFPSTEVGFWVPLSRVTDDDVPHRRDVRWIQVLARLKSGVTAAQAASETTVILKRLAAQYPSSNAGWEKGVVQDLRESIVGQVKPVLLVLLGAVALVLLTACANLANMTLARGMVRQREFAIRRALGAGRTRLLWQSVTESVVLAAFGGAAAFVIGPWISSGLLALSAGSIPRPSEIHIDGSVVLFGVLLTLTAGVLIGSISTLKLTNIRMWESLKAAGTTMTPGSVQQRGRHALVVAEVALACLLLVVSGLALKSLWKLVSADPGFESQHVLTAQLAIPLYKYNTQQRMEAYRDELIRRVAAIPGVEAVGASKTMPLYGGGEPYQFTIKDAARGTVEVVPKGGTYIVTPRYFKALGIPIVSGRAFDERDFADHRGVLVINQELARTYWPGEDPVGKYLYIAPKAKLEVIGVVGDVRNEGLSSEVRGAIYAPMSLMPRVKLDLFIRTAGDPLALSSAVRRIIRDVEPEQPIQDVAPLGQVVHDTLAQPRFFTTVLGTFGAIALLLAATGVFGVLSYTVRQRTREIGIRMALGASRQNVLVMVLRQALALLVLGAGIGIAGALALGRMLSRVLYGVRPTDPMALSAAVLLLCTVALLAALIPARRAANVDPIVALRYE